MGGAAQYRLSRPGTPTTVISDLRECRSGVGKGFTMIKCTPGSTARSVQHWSAEWSAVIERSSRLGLLPTRLFPKLLARRSLRRKRCRAVTQPSGNAQRALPEGRRFSQIR